MSLDDIPAELLQQICSIAVSYDGGKTACSLRSVSRTLRDAMEKYRFASVALETPLQMSKFLDAFRAHSSSVNISERVRHLFLSVTSHDAAHKIIGLVSSTLETFHCIVDADNGARGCPIFVVVLATRFPHLRQLTFHHHADPFDLLVTHNTSLDSALLLYPALTHLHISFRFPCPFRSAHWSSQLLVLRASPCLTDICLSSVELLGLDARYILDVLCVSHEYSSNDSFLNPRPLPVSVKQYTLVPRAVALRHSWERDEWYQVQLLQLGKVAAEVNRRLHGLEFRLLPPQPMPTISKLKQAWLELPRVYEITSW